MVRRATPYRRNENLMSVTSGNLRVSLPNWEEVIAVVRDMADMRSPMTIVEAPNRAETIRGKKVKRDP